MRSLLSLPLNLSPDTLRSNEALKEARQQKKVGGGMITDRRGAL